MATPTTYPRLIRAARLARRTGQLLPEGATTASTKLLWLYLIGPYLARTGSPVRFNVRVASRDLGMSCNTVHRALARLQAAGSIDWQRSKGGRGPNGRGLVTIRPETNKGRS